MYELSHYPSNDLLWSILFALHCSSASAPPGICNPHIIGRPIDGSFRYLILMSDGVYKSLESTFSDQNLIDSNKVLTNMILRAISQQGIPVDAMADYLLLRLMQIHEDCYTKNARKDPRSPLATSCRKRDDMTLIFHKFPTPTSTTSRYWSRVTSVPYLCVVCIYCNSLILQLYQSCMIVWYLSDVILFAGLNWHPYTITFLVLCQNFFGYTVVVHKSRLARSTIAGSKLAGTGPRILLQYLLCCTVRPRARRLMASTLLIDPMRVWLLVWWLYSKLMLAFEVWTLHAIILYLGAH